MKLSILRQSKQIQFVKDREETKEWQDFRLLNELHDALSWRSIENLLSNINENTWYLAKQFGIHPTKILALRSMFCEQRFVPKFETRKFIESMVTQRQAMEKKEMKQLPEPIAIIPRSIYRTLKASALSLYAALSSERYEQGSYTFERSDAEMANIHGMSLKQVRNGRKVLVEKGYIEVISKGKKRTIYHLLPKFLTGTLIAALAAIPLGLKVQSEVNGMYIMSSSKRRKDDEPGTLIDWNNVEEKIAGHSFKYIGTNVFERSLRKVVNRFPTCNTEKLLIALGDLDRALRNQFDKHGPPVKAPGAYLHSRLSELCSNTLTPVQKNLESPSRTHLLSLIACLDEIRSSPGKARDLYATDFPPKVLESLLQNGDVYYEDQKIVPTPGKRFFIPQGCLTIMGVSDEMYDRMLKRQGSKRGEMTTLQSALADAMPKVQV